MVKGPDEGLGDLLRERSEDWAKLLGVPGRFETHKPMTSGFTSNGAPVAVPAGAVACSMRELDWIGRRVGTKDGVVLCYPLSALQTTAIEEQGVSPRLYVQYKGRILLVAGEAKAREGADGATEATPEFNLFGTYFGQGVGDIAARPTF